MSKRIASALLALAAVFGLAACGDPLGESVNDDVGEGMVREISVDLNDGSTIRCILVDGGRGLSGIDCEW